MNVDRLKRLSDFLRNVPPTQFKFDNFWFTKYNGEHESCGTVACALGWACLIPEFRKAGLREYKNKFGHWIPAFAGHQNGIVFDYTQAAEKFFGLTPSQASSIFNPDVICCKEAYPVTCPNVTAEMVADKIDALIASAITNITSVKSAAMELEPA